MPQDESKPLCKKKKNRESRLRGSWRSFERKIIEIAAEKDLGESER